MAWSINFLNEIIISVATAATLALSSLLSESIRTVIFYKRVEYDLVYEKSLTDAIGRGFFWDIQWEDYRLTLKVDDISNNKLEDVVFVRNEVREEKLGTITASDRFTPLFGKEIYYKLNSIIRSTPPTGQKSYILRFVLRRR